MSLRESAMLCDLKLTSFTGERTSKRTSREVTEQKNAEHGSATVTIKMIPGKYLKEIRSVDQRLRTTHNLLTMPWGHDDSNLLPSSLFFDHVQKIGDLGETRKQEIAAFKQLYPMIRDSAETKQRLGDLYDEIDWPSADEVEAMFTMKVVHRPIPSGDDFRLDLDESEVLKIRAEVEAEVKASLDASMKAIKDRIVVALQDFVDRVGDYQVVIGPDGPKTVGVFRNSILDNLSRLVEVLPNLNLLNDQLIDDATVEIKSKIISLDADTLRDNDAVRVNTLQIAKRLIKSLS